MKIKYLVPIIFFGTIFSCNTHNKNDMIQAPIAEKKPKELTIHGDTRIDDYYWMNDRTDSNVINYLKAENTYLKHVLKHTENFQKSLFEEIKSRIKKNDSSVPYFYHGYYYYTKYSGNKEYPVYCRKKSSLDAQEEIILDQNKLAKGHAYYSIGNFEVSPDNHYVAFAVDTQSRRIYTIYFLDLRTGKILENCIAGTTPNMEWSADSKHFYYTIQDETLRPHKLMLHTIDDQTGNDKEVYTESDPTFRIYVTLSKSEKFLMLISESTLSTEYRILAADQPGEEFRIFADRKRNHEYDVDHIHNSFIIRTNKNAKNFKLMQCQETDFSETSWTEMIPHREDVFLEGFELLKDYYLIEERKKGLVQFHIKSWDKKKDYYIDFGEEAYMAYAAYNVDPKSNVLRFEYTSLTTPKSTFDYDLGSKEKVLLKEQEVVGSFDKEDYTTRRLFARADDGTEIPISLVYRNDLKKEGPQPLYLYGYGSYGYSLDASFRSQRLSLLNRGFIFAIAHIRGGQEMGRDWYENGKLLKKKNTFTDFIDCAEFLIRNDFTDKENLFAVGGSAGGLLVGAVANMKPEIFKGIVAHVPFVDVVTTMLDESIPLTTAEYDEWGNPNNKEYYDYMLSYSPYNNVEKKEYPAMLVTTGLHDSQVQYWEPAKWVAKLREMKTDDNPLLLHINMETGHSGASGRFKYYKEVAMEYAFIFDLKGIKE